MYIEENKPKYEQYDTTRNLKILQKNDHADLLKHECEERSKQILHQLKKDKTSKKRSLKQKKEKLKLLEFETKKILQNTRKKKFVPR